MAILTFAEAAKLSQSKIYQKILYGAIAEDPMLAQMSLEYSANKDEVYFQTFTLPTSAWRIETDAMTSTAPVDRSFTVSLKNVYTQMQVPPFNETSLSDVFNQRAENVKKMSRSYGDKIRSATGASSSVTTAIGATATTKGIDGVKPSARMPAGLAYLTFDDTADTIAFSTDGVTYGTAVSTTADLHQVPLYDGVDPTLFILLTMDVSDSEGSGDWTTTNAATGVTFASSKEPDGLYYWCWGEQRTWGTLTDTPTATGDALSFEQMDWLADQVPGDEENLAYVMPQRTRRSFKALMRAAGGIETVDTFMGRKLHRKVLGYENKPIWVNNNIPLTEAAGVGASGTGLTCTSVYLVRFAANPQDDGFALKYHTVGGPTVRVTDWNEEKQMPVPAYFRDIGEMETLPDHILRMDGYFAGVLRNTQAMAEVHGIKD